MLYEFAMTPDLFDAAMLEADSASNVILIELLKGIAENGLLANLHKGGWSCHVREERVPTLSPDVRGKVISCLSMLDKRHRLACHPKCVAGSPATDMDWLNLALESHQGIPFHAIVSSHPLIDDCDQDCDALVEFFSSLDSGKWDGRRRRDLTLTKSPPAYRAALAPILRHAKSLVLVDPWLNSDEARYFDTVTICSNVMGQRGHTRLQGRIHIHGEAGKQKPPGRSPTDYLNAWDQKLRPLVAVDNHRFKVFLWESIPGSESMHDRYILTDQCGLSIPAGLDCRTHSYANSTTWSLLDDVTLQLRWSDYDPSASPFNLLGDREIP